ncbi:PREDICTED: tripartite motif-containing protein 58-like, partial [Leptosomus discolor]|uniref:tripartite motif-containing protein 58-like n=1 Tax=Leptosomus discolor TaxID=188344 RepID=UPI0005223FDB
VVTLDLDTAHSKLVLSADRRRVRWHHTWQSLPENPKRFTYWCCVLGWEGFREGRHCWEVEVQGEVGGDSWWAIGVARDSVERDHTTKFSPEGGIWAVTHCRGQFEALTNPCTPLSQSPLPRKIWVCLDCARGLVAFINADNGAGIFTFPPASFSGEVIRPWFRLVTEKTQLILTGSTPQTLGTPSPSSVPLAGPCPPPLSPAGADIHLRPAPASDG